MLYECLLGISGYNAVDRTYIGHKQCNLLHIRLYNRNISWKILVDSGRMVQGANQLVRSFRLASH